MLRRDWRRVWWVQKNEGGISGRHPDGLCDDMSDAVSKMKQTEVELRNMIDVLQESASYNRDKIKEQKEVISEFQDTVEGLTDDIDEYKENLLEANNVLKKLRRYIGGIVASGQRELGDHYDGFSRVSDFVRDRCRSAD